VEKKQRLLEILAEKSFMYSEEPTFRLASGKMSSFYVNCKKTAYHPEGINLIGEAVCDLIEKYSPDAIGGLTLGADPIAVATAGESFRRGRPVKAFVVRKQTKEHGTKVPIEGDMHPGEKVVIIEDVITTGGSAITAVKSAREFGLDIVCVIALVDRGEGGKEAIESESIPVESLFTKEDILRQFRANNETGKR